VLGGASYEIYRFENLPSNADVRDLDFISAHAGAGLKYRLSHNAALRMELNSEFGDGSPTFGAFMGVSFMKGAKRPTPAVRTVTVTNVRVDTVRVTLPPRIDTVRVTRTDTLRVFRPDSEVVLTLDDVNFDFDRSTLRAEARPLLDRAAQELNSNTFAAIHIEVVGFTDSRGTDDYNLRLGMRRAKTVTDYLVSKGVAASRLTVLSGGEGSPIADNGNDAGRAQNRRVIIKRGVNK
jgi:outer membrane protein OmpA-like peptidoglycan-associated protein